MTTLIKTNNLIKIGIFNKGRLIMYDDKRFIKALILFLFIAFHAQINAQILTTCTAMTMDASEQKNAIKWPDHHHKQLLNKNRWINAQQMEALLPTNPIWVDIRNHSDHSDTGLSLLSIPLSQLGNSSFLFNKTVILIGSGFDQTVLNQQMERLAQKGFKHLFALSGGIRTWQSFNQGKLNNMLTIEEFMQGGQTISWKIITIGLNNEEIALLPEKPIQNFTLSRKSISKLTQFIRNHHSETDSFIHYVLIARDEQAIRLLKNRLSQSVLTNAVWLSDGLTGYQQYIQQQHQLITNSGKSLVRPCSSTL